MYRFRTTIWIGLLVVIASSAYFGTSAVTQRNAVTTCREAARFLQLGNPQRARDRLRWLLWFHPDHPEALHISGRSLLEEKNYTSAVEYLTRVRLHSSAHRPAHLELVAALLADYQMEHAEQALRVHLRQYPEEFIAVTQLHGLLLAQYRADAACDLMVAEIRHDDFPRLSVAHQLACLRMLAKAEFDADSPVSCLPLLLESYDHHPNQSSVALAIGICAWKSGDLDTAHQYLSVASEMSAGEPEFILAESEFRLATGDLEAAQSILQQLPESAKSGSNGRNYHRIQSRLSELGGENEIALDFAMRALKEQPSDRESHSRVARLLQKLGRISEAKSYYEQSHQLAKNEIALWNLTRTLPDMPTSQDCRIASDLYEQLGRTDRSLAWSRIAERLKTVTDNHAGNPP